MMVIEPPLDRYFSGPDAFDRVLALEGEVFRELAGRRTLRFEVAGESYFVKIHLGVGWKEIVKNLAYLRLPILGARSEWLAIQRFEELDVATMTIMGFGERGFNPAKRQSFLITRDLQGTISLEDFCRDWPQQSPPVALKRALIEKVACLARTLHENGVNHRDFYICHFLLDKATVRAPFRTEALRLHVIDLHRVQIRKHTPRRWVVKDVAGLYFSSMDIGLTRRDLFRFMKIYRGRSLRDILGDESQFWGAVSNRAIKLYRKTFHRPPPLPTTVS